MVDVLNIRTEGTNSIRSVGGEVVSSFVADTSTARLEILSRKCGSKIHWNFRQPYWTLLWWRSGHKFLSGKVDGRRVDYALSETANLGLFPPNTDILSEFDVLPYFNYTIMFIDPDFVTSRLSTTSSGPKIAFHHSQLKEGLKQLCEQSETPDNIFSLLLEGWSVQALAHIGMLSARGDDVQGRPGGFSRKATNRIEEYLRSQLPHQLSLEEIANVSGVSRRQFVRAFPASFGETPHRYLLALRLQEAKRLLLETEDCITEIGQACGFLNSQHFATRFRRAVGVSPSEFRRQSSGNRSRH